MTNALDMKRKVFIVALMKKQIIDFLNNTCPLGDLVDGLYTLIQDFEGQTAENFFEPWSWIEGVYAGVHYVRDYYTAEEVAVTCNALIKFAQLIFTYEQEYLKYLTPPEENLEENIYSPVHIEPNSLIIDQKDAVMNLRP